ncbi:MAG: hypothetical protein HYX41_01810 [Bdellovibrio sp.]|nr:hypothetical protein [Bdellovibrio sp.]
MRITLGYPWINCFLAILLLIVTGCKTAPKFEGEISSEDLLSKVCEIGRENKSAKGTAWIKVHYTDQTRESSRDISGQYSTTVLVSSPEYLKLTIDNILGGTEATLVVNKNHYSITRGEGRAGSSQGNGTWHGVPLSWAIGLYLGRIPCPNRELVANKTSNVKSTPPKMILTQQEKGVLEASVSDAKGSVVEIYRYSFKTYFGRPWPDSLRWTRFVGEKVEVEFKFDLPEERSLNPRRWEAASKDSFLKVVWKDRSVLDR